MEILNIKYQDALILKRRLPTIREYDILGYSLLLDFKSNLVVFQDDFSIQINEVQFINKLNQAVVLDTRSILFCISRLKENEDLTIQSNGVSFYHNYKTIETVNIIYPMFLHKIPIESYIFYEINFSDIYNFLINEYTSIKDEDTLKLEFDDHKVLISIDNTTIKKEFELIKKTYFTTEVKINALTFLKKIQDTDSNIMGLMPRSKIMYIRNKYSYIYLLPIDESI
ncbi:MAG: hypothetical protein ACRC31_08165 [Cetobacterium sp.]